MKDIDLFEKKKLNAGTANVSGPAGAGTSSGGATGSADGGNADSGPTDSSKSIPPMPHEDRSPNYFLGMYGYSPVKKSGKKKKKKKIEFGKGIYDEGIIHLDDYR